MPLNASGAISLGGSTAGQSIALELARLATAQISINCSAVRTLAGVASGAISFSNFYGKSNGPTVGIFYAGSRCASKIRTTTATRINACGALVGTESTIACGIARNSAGGSSICNVGMYWGGSSGSGVGTNTALRINKCGSRVGSVTTPTSLDAASTQDVTGSRAGSVATYASCGGAAVGIRIIRLNACQALLSQGSVSVCGGNRTDIAGSNTPVGNNAMFHGGGDPGCCGAYCSYSNVVRINPCGTKVGTTPAIGTARWCHAGAVVGVNALFYGGTSVPCCNSGLTLVTRINACAALVGSQTNAGSNGRIDIGGALVGVNGLFFGGLQGLFNSAPVNRVTRINACGALVGTETTAGTGRMSVASASA